MSALAFDPWAALKVIQGGCPPANPANPAKPGAEVIDLAAIRECLASAEYAEERAAVAAEPEPDRTPLPPPAPVLVERLVNATGGSPDAARARLEPLDPLARGLLLGAVEASARNFSEVGDGH